MPTRDKVKNAAYQHAWYERNKDVQKARTKKIKEDLQAWFLEYKSKQSCCKCGESHIATLDFHHLDSSKKEFSLAWR